MSLITCCPQFFRYCCWLTLNGCAYYHRNCKTVEVCLLQLFSPKPGHLISFLKIRSSSYLSQMSELESLIYLCLGFRMNASSWPMFLLRTLSGAEMAPASAFKKVITPKTPCRSPWMPLMLTLTLTSSVYCALKCDLKLLKLLQFCIVFLSLLVCKPHHILTK